MAGAVSFRMLDGKDVEYELTRFRMNATNTRPVMVEMADHIAGMQRDHFKTEGKHYGPGWVALSPRYKAWKMRRHPGKPILELSGTLKSQAAPKTGNQFGYYRVTRSRMEVGVSLSRTPHAEFHQDGTEHMPARPVVGDPTAADQKALTKILHTALVKGVPSARR